MTKDKKIKKSLMIVFTIVMSFSFLFGGLKLINLNKGTVSASTLSKAQELSDLWDTYKNNNVSSLAGVKVVELNDFISAGFWATGHTEWGDIVETSWTHSDAIALIGGENAQPDDYCFLISNARELMYFSYFANGKHPSVTAMPNLTDVQALFLNSKFYLGNNIYYDGRTYFIYDGTNVLTPESNACYSGASIPFLPVLDFNGSFNGQGFEIINLNIGGYTFQSGLNSYSYSSMFVNATGIISNFGLLNTTVDLNAYTAAANQNFPVISAYTVSTAQLKNLYAVDTKYIDIGGDETAFISSIYGYESIAPSASEYYLFNSYYYVDEATTHSMTLQADNYNTASLYNGNLLWYGTGCYNYDNTLSSSYSFAEDSHTIAKYNYNRLYGMRKIGHSITFNSTEFTDYSLISGSTYNYNLYKPSDVICYLDSIYFSQHLYGVIKNDMDFKTVSKYAYYPVYGANYGVIGLIGYKPNITSNLTIDIDTFSTEAAMGENGIGTPSSLNSVDIYNLNNKTYRVSTTLTGTVTYIVSGLFENSSSPLVMGNLNFIGGYTALAKEAMDNALYGYDANGNIISVTNEAVIEYGYAVGLVARLSSNGGTFFNFYSDMEVYLEKGDNLYLRELNLGGLAGRVDFSSTTRYNIAYNTVISGNIDSGSACTFANATNIFTGGIYGNFNSGNGRNSAYDKLVFSGIVTGFKPQYSTATNANIYATAYTGGFAGRYQHSTFGNKKFNSILVNGEIHTLKAEIDTNNYNYTTGVNIYAGGMIGFDNTTTALMINGGSFRFSGKMVYNTYYTNYTDSTNFINFYVAMYAGRYTNNFNENGSTLYAKSNLSALTDADIICGSYYSYYTEDGQTFSLSNQNEVVFSNSKTRNYVSVFIAYKNTNNIENCVNQIDLNVRGTCNYAFVFPFGNAAYSLKNVTNEGNINISGLTAVNVYASGLVNNLNNSTSSPSISTESCKNYGNIIFSGNTVSGNSYFGGAFYSIGTNTIVDGVENYGNFTADTSSGGIHFGGITYNLTNSTSTIQNCVNYGNVIGNDLIKNTFNIGGITAYINNGTIDNCTNNGNLNNNIDFSAITSSTYYRWGGIVGYVYDSNIILDIKNCINKGNIVFTPLNGTYSGTYIYFDLSLGGIVGYSRARVLNISDTVNMGDITITKYNDNIINASSYRYFARFGGIVGFVDGNSAAMSAKIISVINYGNITNGYTNGGIVGMFSTKSAGGLFVNGAINYGDVYNDTVYLSRNDFYSIGNGGIFGFLAGDDLKIYNTVNSGRIIKNTVNNYSGGIIGQLATERNSDSYNYNNLSRTAGSFGVFNGSLYILNDVSTNYADCVVGNIVIDSSYAVNENLAIATPENAAVSLNTGAALFAISDSATNGIYGSNFFWSIKNEITYGTVSDVSFAYVNSALSITVTSYKAIETSQIVFSKQAQYGNVSFNSGGAVSVVTSSVNEARGHFLNGENYIFALTTSNGRRDGVYVGENIKNIETSTAAYIKQITVSRDNFINKAAIGNNGVSNIILTDTLNNINFSSTMVSEKLEKTENEYDTLFVNVLNHGEYINGADTLGASYVNFKAYEGSVRNYVVNNGNEDIFSLNSRISIENISATEFLYDSQTPNWNFIAYKGLITVWQGESETTPPTDTNYYIKYNIYIIFIDVENTLNFSSFDVNNSAIYTPQDTGYQYLGNTVSGTHTFANDIEITSASDFSMRAVFAADGVPNNAAGRTAILTLNSINPNADYSSFGFTTGDLDVSSGMWTFSSSYVPDDSSGESQELQDLIDELGEGGIYLKSTVTFDITLNPSYNELPAGNYSLTLKVYKGRENDVDIFYEHTFILVKGLSGDVSLQYNSTTATNGTVTTSGINLFFRDGATYTATSNRTVNFVVSENTFTGTYTFGFFPDFETLNIDGNTIADLFQRGMAVPKYSKVGLPKSVTITTNENGTHSVTFVFDLISEEGKASGTNTPSAEYTFILNESAPQVTVTVFKNSLPLGSRTDDVGRGTDPVYLLDYNISTSGVSVKNNTFKIYNDYNLLDLNNLGGLIPPTVEVNAINKYNVIFSKQADFVTSGGDWMLYPYLIFGSEGGINVTVKTQPQDGVFSTETINVEWDDLTVDNTDVHFIKQTSRLCYAEDIGVSNSELGVLSYYGTTNSTFEEGCGLVGQGTDMLSAYRKYSYLYGSINTDLSGGLVSKYRIKNFVNYLTIGNDEIQGDYFYSTYLIIAINKSDSETLLYNDAYTGVKYKILGNNSTVPDFTPMTTLNVTDDNYTYYVFWMDESISVPAGNESSGLSLKIRLTAENPLYYTEYDFIFRTPLKNKDLTLNVKTSYDTDLLESGGIWDNNYANICLKTGFYNAESGLVSYTRAVNMLYLLSTQLASKNPLYQHFLAQEIETDTYFKSYKMIKYPAARYYFYYDVPKGYKAVVTKVMVMQSGGNIILTDLTPLDGIYSYVKSDFTEWVYLAEDFSYIELGGNSASSVVVDIEIVPSTDITPPPWGVIV